MIVPVDTWKKEFKISDKALHELMYGNAYVNLKSKYHNGGYELVKMDEYNAKVESQIKKT